MHHEDFHYCFLCIWSFCFNFLLPSFFHLKLLSFLFLRFSYNYVIFCSPVLLPSPDTYLSLLYLCPKYLSFYAQVSIVLIPHQGNFYVQQKTPLQKITNIRSAAELLSPDPMNISTKELLHLRIIVEQMEERFWESEEQEVH